MEIKRQTSANGTTHRIIAWTACNHTFYEIEFLKYQSDDINWWEKEISIVYNSRSEVEKVFNGLMK